ncbi:nucleotidase [Bacillus coahuilensis m2-6]|uniref:Nucleotidase n=1 Tax=Bacillus coahuilensis p1.1.43 TaxID=1150625 RepID=A0A147K7E9_9BACI|nr:nucleotidase [Bacillus coahuilensis]KUP05999.1 nucleotidase [Bacillus coahuilensis p1.1.43]KUP07214.1 nucleotidase [Bacillus coahuilensis m2-6]
MQKKRFGIDIDGTVTCPTSLVPYINEAFNLTATLDDITHYDLAKSLNLNPEKFWVWFQQAEATIYEESPMAQGAKSILTSWKEEHELFFISARPSHLLDVTQKWFSENDLHYHHIELIGSHNKLNAAKKYGVEVFFEDKHDNAVMIAEELNIPVILFDTPYNREPVPSLVQRVQDWQEANQWIEHWILETSK